MCGNGALDLFFSDEGLFYVVIGHCLFLVIEGGYKRGLDVC